MLNAQSFIAPDWPAPSNVRAVSTTRIGGVSEGVFSSLNLGGHVGDSAQTVARNRALVKEALALTTEPCWLQQVHGRNLIDAEASGGQRASADGAYTNVANTVCAIMTADCLPLLLTNKAGSQVAAVHAGWRGMAANIIELMVAKFDCDAADVIAWAGPSIGPQKFEVGSEVREQLGGSNAAYVELPNGKLLANLYRLAEERLNATGVGEFSYEEACTYSDSERFFSYRRDGQCGRMASLIWLEAE